MEVNIPIILTFLVASLDFILGGVILAQNPRDKTNVTYALFATSVALWGFSVGGFLYITDPIATDFLARLLYFAGGSIPATFLLFSLIFTFPKLAFGKSASLVLLPSGVFFFLYFFTDTIIQGYEISEDIKAFQYGILSYIFDVHLWGYFIITFFILLKNYTTQKISSKKQHTLFVIFSTYAVLAIAGASNVIGPRVDIFDLIWIGPVATVFWIVIVAYAVARYQLFNIRIIVAELLVISLWVFLLIRIFISTGREDLWINSISFVVVFILGFYLIRGVIKEVLQREQIEKLAEDLEKANVRLRELNRQKSEFVSIASHQLRSPLTAIKGYASLILEGSYGKVTKTIKEPVQKIFDSSQLMVLSVEDFLNVSRIEQGRMKYEMSVFNLKDLVQMAVDDMTPVARKKKLELVYKPKKEEKYSIRADFGKIKQVINNVIDNAIKYTPKGSVTVSISKNEKTGKILITITDTGVGISEHTLPHLFERFRRAKNANEVNVDGSGLGLFIAKQMIIAHKGRIWAESKGEGKGSTFYIELNTVDFS